MNGRADFSPPRRRGGVFLLLLAGSLGGLGAYGVAQAATAQDALTLVLFMLLGLPAALGLPLLAYQLYGLSNANYSLERNGIRLQWGLRVEEIPINRVQWVRAEGEAGLKLPMPFPAWPGAVTGRRRLAEGGEVEFFASQGRELVLLSTPERVYAISPKETHAFLETYRRLAELGSITPIQARSVHPARLLADFWGDRWGRALLFAGGMLSLALLVATAAASAGRGPVVLHLRPGLQLADAVPAARLLLLPLLNGGFFFINLILGLFFYRRPNTQPLAYLMWVTSLITALLFSGAVALILLRPG